MTKRFDYYYLQRNAGTSWDTLKEAESITVLSLNLADLLETPGEAKIRIVGALYDVHSEAWAYEQLFYIDQSSIDLGIAEQGESPLPEPNSERDKELIQNGDGVNGEGIGEEGDLAIGSEWRNFDARRTALYKRPAFNFDDRPSGSSFAGRIIRAVAVLLI